MARIRLRSACCCVLLLLSVLCAGAAQAQENAPRYSQTQLQTASRNIVKKVDRGSGQPILIVASSSKRVLAEEIARQALAQKLSPDLLLLPGDSKLDFAVVKERVQKATKLSGMVWLIDEKDNGLLFSIVGRPDQGIKIPTEHLFCDWLADMSSTIRTQAIDPEETESFRLRLYEKLRNAKRITITTPAGTRITVEPRTWNTFSGDTSEIYTAPVERIAEGQIVVDGSAYWGPPPHPIVLKIQAGKITNLADLDKTDKQQMWMSRDLTTDENASVLAELGLGINAEANPQADLMEAEQARGTCHFGFGNNLEYGGKNSSRKHVDYVLLRPTIWVDEVCICRDGKYLF